MKLLIPTGRFAYPEEVAAIAVFLRVRPVGHGQRCRYRHRWWLHNSLTDFDVRRWALISGVLVRREREWASSTGPGHDPCF